MLRLTALLVISLGLAACSSFPSERQLVGTWTMPRRTIQNEFGITQWRSKQMAENTLRSDHTYTSRHVGRRGMVTGRWRLSGRWLVYEFPTRQNRQRVLEHHRAKILKVSDRELIFPDDNVWTRVR